MENSYDENIYSNNKNNDEDNNACGREREREVKEISLVNRK